MRVLWVLCALSVTMVCSVVEAGKKNAPSTEETASITSLVDSCVREKKSNELINLWPKYLLGLSKEKYMTLSKRDSKLGTTNPNLYRDTLPGYFTGGMPGQKITLEQRTKELRKITTDIKDAQNHLKELNKKYIESINNYKNTFNEIAATVSVENDKIFDEVAEASNITDPKHQMTCTAKLALALPSRAEWVKHYQTCQAALETVQTAGCPTTAESKQNNKVLQQLIVDLKKNIPREETAAGGL